MLLLTARFEASRVENEAASTLRSLSENIVSSQGTPGNVSCRDDPKMNALDARPADEKLHLNSPQTKRKRDGNEPTTSDLKKTRKSSKTPDLSFSINDRVLIKGNKRTPLNVIGREAVVTYQCLNGWYLVTVVGSGERLRLQYRSLESFKEGPSVSAASEKNPAPDDELQQQKMCSNTTELQEHAGRAEKTGVDEALPAPLVRKESSLEFDDRCYKRNPVKQRDELVRDIRREMLRLEKLVPWSLLSFSWTSRRVEWRRNVRECMQLKELGFLMHLFRQNLLLESAGKMSDSAWEQELVTAIRRGNKKRFRALWRKLNDDAQQLVELKSSRSFSDDLELELDLQELRRVFPQLQVKGRTPVWIIAATILACAEAIARGEKEAEDVLELPMKLMKNHGYKQLGSIREALEREKRHLTAKLSQLKTTVDT